MGESALPANVCAFLRFEGVSRRSVCLSRNETSKSGLPISIRQPPQAKHKSYAILAFECRRV